MKRFRLFTGETDIDLELNIWMRKNKNVRVISYQPMYRPGNFESIAVLVYYEDGRDLYD